MNEVIERVAKAIRAPIADGSTYEDIARIAIAAMRKPTEAMVRAGREIHPLDWGSCYDHGSIDIEDLYKSYQAMIDKILEQK